MPLICYVDEHIHTLASATRCHHVRILCGTHSDATFASPCSSQQSGRNCPGSNANLRGGFYSLPEFIDFKLFGVAVLNGK